MDTEGALATSVASPRLSESFRAFPRPQSHRAGKQVWANTGRDAGEVLENVVLSRSVSLDSLIGLEMSPLENCHTAGSEGGTLGVVHETLIWKPGQGEGWEIPISEIRFIGEFTNKDGPFADDWFLVFVTREMTRWFEVPVGVNGRGEALSALERSLGPIGGLRLVHSTSFASRIMWPGTREGEALFDWTGSRQARVIQGLRTDLSRPN